MCASFDQQDMLVPLNIFQLNGIVVFIELNLRCNKFWRQFSLFWSCWASLFQELQRHHIAHPRYQPCRYGNRKPDMESTRQQLFHSIFYRCIICKSCVCNSCLLLDGSRLEEPQPQLGWMFGINHTSSLFPLLSSSRALLAVPASCKIFLLSQKAAVSETFNFFLNLSFCPRSRFDTTRV
jgi:hypothetical protein